MEHGESGPKNDQERQFMDQQRQGIRDAVVQDQAGQIDEQQTANNLQQRIEQINTEATDAEQNVQNNNYTGEAQTPNTPRHNEIVTQITVQEVLTQYKNNNAYFNRVIPEGSISAKLLNNVCQAIGNPNVQVGISEAPYVYKIINQAIHNRVQNPLEILNNQELENLAIHDRGLHNRLVAIIAQTARESGQPEETIKEFVQRHIPTPEMDYTETILHKRLGTKEREFFMSLQSVESFQRYCIEQRDGPGGAKDRLRTNPDFVAASDEIKEKMIAWELSVALKNRATGVIYKIYEPVLTALRDEPLEQLRREHGTIYSNPQSLASTFEERFVNLITRISENPVEGLKFISPRRETVTVYDPKKKETETYERILSDISTYSNSPAEFIQFIKRNNESEQARLIYGFDLEFLTRTFDVKPDQTLMSTIKGYAGRMNTSMIDEIFADSSGEMVQSAITIFDLKNEELFSKENWRKNPLNASEYFNNVTAMTKYTEDFIREQYKTKYEGWMIERAIFNAKLIIYGVYFKPMHWFSYADPDLTSAGTSTYGGEREMGLATFDPGNTGKRFHGDQPGTKLGHELSLKGVDFLPLNYIINNYRYTDWKKFYEAWQKSFTQGKAAYWELVGADFQTIKLLIDIGNVASVNAGGFDTISGWRVFLASQDWIRDYIGTNDKIKFGDEQVMVNMWKRLENIGIDALENYVKKFVIGEIPKMGEVLTDENKLGAIKNLYVFLYDRYLSTDIGKTFLTKADGSQMSRNELIAEVEDILTNKKLTKKEKDGVLNDWIYKALTVVMYERMPLKFALLEKPRLTQNGVTIMNQLRDYSVTNKWVKGQFDDAISDLILVQAELRRIVSDDMDKIRNKSGDDRNLFGDLNKNVRSDVNNKRGYVINEDVIEEILGRLNRPAERINRAREIYRQLGEKVKQPPEEAVWETEIRDSKDKNKIAILDERVGLYKTRLEWFKEMYKNNEFGYSPTSGELALRFLSLSSSGPDTIKRLASYCQNSAEAISTMWAGFRDDLKNVRSSKKWDDVYKKLEKLYTQIEAEAGAGEAPQEVIQRFLQRAIYFFKDDNIGNIIPLKGVIDWAIRRSSSFSEEDAGGPGKAGAWKMNQNEIIRLVSQMSGDLGRAIIPEKPIEPMMKKVKPSKLYGVFGEIAERLGGKDIRVRDWANDISGQALKKVNQSGMRKYFESYVNPRIMLIFLAIALLLGYKAFQSDFTIGQKK